MTPIILLHRLTTLSLCLLCLTATVAVSAPTGSKGFPALRVGTRLPDATLIGTDGSAVRLSDARGRTKILSIVPQLNTPVCDEQTHRFSEDTGGLDQHVDILTLSTNTPTDQARFAKKAKINNVTFLSDSPAYDFGKQTGLLLPMHGILHRAVIVADTNNVIRYVEIVPLGQLPNFDAAYEAAQRLLGQG